MASTKQTGVPCYDKAADDEPIFVLRAADPSAPKAVRAWAFQAEMDGHRREKIVGALQDAADMEAWQAANPEMVRRAANLADIGVHKQYANRLLEPFAWHTAVITATDFDNLFHLRVNPAAQGEFQRIAEMMLELRHTSVPVELGPDEWHLPYVRHVADGPDDGENAEEFNLEVGGFDPVKVSVSRCARVSYLTQNGVRDPAEDVALFDRLLTPGHMAPLEHVARPMDAVELGMFLQWQVTAKRKGEDVRTMRVSVPPNELQERFGFEVLASREVHYSGKLNGWISRRALVAGEHDILGYRSAVATSSLVEATR